MRNGRYCIPVKSEYRSQVPGMIHDQSSTGSTIFVEPVAVVKLNNDIRELEIQEAREIEAILAALSEQTAQYTELLQYDMETLAELDFIFARASLAMAVSYTHLDVYKRQPFRRAPAHSGRNIRAAPLPPFPHRIPRFQFRSCLLYTSNRQSEVLQISVLQ